MRFVVLAMLVCIACSGVDDTELNSVLESNATSYVAADDPDPRYDYRLTITLTHRNTSELVIRVPSCSATVPDPMYNVERTGTGEAAWDPDYTCVASGAPYEDLAPGEHRTFTLSLRAPWQRLFNGQPVGEVEGSFFVVLQTQICGRVSSLGVCTPAGRIELVRSNSFTITTP